MGVPRPRARARARTSDRRTEDAERHDGTEGRGRGRSGARGAPGALRGGDMSKSVAKALRGAIGREKNRGISTFLFAHPGRIRAFATDLDNPRRRGPLHGRRPRRSPRSRAGPLRPRAPRRALRTRKCSSNRHSRVQNAHLGEEGAGVAVLADRGAGPAPERLRRPGGKCSVRCHCRFGQRENSRREAPHACDAWRCCLARLLTCRGGASGRGARRTPVGAIETAPGTGKEGDAS